MLKLIVSDLHESLLNDKKEISTRFENILKELDERNIKFIITTDEPLETIKLHLKKHNNVIIMFSSDNGIVVNGNNHKNFTQPLDKYTNKGTALKSLQTKLCLLPQETMVFGRFNDDIEMFKQASFTYAFEESPSELKRIATGVINTNDDDSICKRIEDYIDKFIYGRI